MLTSPHPHVIQYLCTAHPRTLLLLQQSSVQPFCSITIVLNKVFLASLTLLSKTFALEIFKGNHKLNI